MDSNGLQFVDVYGYTQFSAQRIVDVYIFIMYTVFMLSVYSHFQLHARSMPIPCSDRLTERSLDWYGFQHPCSINKPYPLLDKLTTDKDIVTGTHNKQEMSVTYTITQYAHSIMSIINIHVYFYDIQTLHFCHHFQYV